MNLKGTNAIVTGGSRGIGPYIARALARQGTNIVLAARDAERLEAVRKEVESLGVKAISIPTDVNLADDRRNLIEQASSGLGEIDLLVNNAGIEPTSAFVDIDESRIVDTIDTNLTSCLLLMRAVLPAMVERGKGQVVNIASMAGKIPIPYDSIYSATKFALVGASHAVRSELRGTGVGVSVICPGFIVDAGMYADAVDETGVAAPAIAGTSRPEQVANAVVRAAKHDVAEVIVTPLSGRPLAAAAAVAPNIGQAMMRLTGVQAAFKHMADQRAAKRQ
ncbi:MAG: SDR family NAD(P)-dependent oxidoreductase [Chloroflexi bacterium]|nr:SDR family NAD(P)-dependent oxidoreductase [Chloroflexota bacterium]